LLLIDVSNHKKLQHLAQKAVFTGNKGSQGDYHAGRGSDHGANQISHLLLKRESDKIQAGGVIYRHLPASTKPFERHIGTYLRPNLVSFTSSIGAWTLTQNRTVLEVCHCSVLQFYSYFVEDEGAALLKALKDEFFFKTGEKLSDSEIQRLATRKRWKQRYSEFLRTHLTWCNARVSGSLDRNLEIKRSDERPVFTRNTGEKVTTGVEDHPSSDIPGMDTVSRDPTRPKSYMACQSGGATDPNRRLKVSRGCSLIWQLWHETSADTRHLEEPPIPASKCAGSKMNKREVSGSNCGRHR
jgi:hypothetical protein